MTAADAEHRRASRADKAPELLQVRRIVVIKIAQRSAQDDGVRLKIARGLGQF